MHLRVREVRDSGRRLHSTSPILRLLPGQVCEYFSQAAETELTRPAWQSNWSQAEARCMVFPKASIVKYVERPGKGIGRSPVLYLQNTQSVKRIVAELLPVSLYTKAVQPH